MKRKEEKQILDLIKKCACFYSQDGKVWHLKTSIVVSKPELIKTLRKFFTEE